MGGSLSTRQRAGAIAALGGIGPAERVLPTLLAVLEEDPSEFFRELAARSIGQLGPAAEPAIPALARALEDANGTFRSNTVRALQVTGPASIPVLEAALESRDRWVRRHARQALEALRSPPPAHPAP